VPRKQANAIDAHVGHRVRLRRMLMGMSQERLGELLGLTFQQVQKYEKGLNRVGAGRLFEVAGILGVPISYFYEGAGNGAKPGGRSASKDDTAAVMEFLSTGDGLQLCLAFKEIKNKRIRRRMLELMRSLSDSKPDDSD
jgi:transcriptional regulator with XRE-family HTH domain